MRAALVLAVLLVASPADARDSWRWTKTDTVLETLAVGMIAVDWGQTRWFTTRTDVPEANPLLGRHPSLRRVDLTIGSAIVGHVLLARVLPKPWRTLLQFGTIVGDGIGVQNNVHRFGFHVRFDFL